MFKTTITKETIVSMNDLLKAQYDGLSKADSNFLVEIDKLTNELGLIIDEVCEGESEEHKTRLGLLIGANLSIEMGKHFHDKEVVKIKLN